MRSRSDALATELIQDAQKIGARRLLLLGDIKHKYTHNSPQEGRDLPRFFRTLQHTFEQILITPGNHDTGLRSLVPRKVFPHVRIGNAQGEVLRGSGLRVAAMHGHTWPRPAIAEADVWLVGHTHAAASIVNEQGEPGTEWAWLRGRLDADKMKQRYGRSVAPHVVVFPPFNPLCGGTPINRDGILGPVGSLIDAASASLWLLNGRRAVDLAGTSLVSRRKMDASRS